MYSHVGPGFSTCFLTFWRSPRMLVGHFELQVIDIDYEGIFVNTRHIHIGPGFLTCLYMYLHVYTCFRKNVSGPTFLFDYYIAQGP